MTTGRSRVAALGAAAGLTSALLGCARPATGPSPSASRSEVSGAEASAPRLGPSIPASRASGAPAQGASADSPARPGERRAPLGTCGLVAHLERAPDGRFSLVLQNRGASELRLVVPGDGSEAGWRTPALAWTATSGGRPVSVEPARCGLMNPIDEQEIFSLSPGAERRLTEWVTAPQLPGGDYELRLRYRNDPGLIDSRVTATAEVRRKLAESSACEVATPPLRVTLP
ncbi:MAG: hypothetical protein OZ928_08820 [Polyangiaceae bacterium]|nr:hypothetical protein [Polyangiaceae bacterium]